MEINLGKIKVWYQRSMIYINLVRTLMIIAIFFNTVSWSWWYLVCVPAIPVLLYFDIKTIYKQELDYGYNKSSFMKDLQRKIDVIYEKIKIME